MSFYVKREKDGRTGWVGPIRSFQQARREFAAWEDAGWSAEIEDTSPDIAREVRAGRIRSSQQARREFAAWEDAGWSAKIEDTSPEIRREVREWQREADKRLGR